MEENKNDNTQPVDETVNGSAKGNSEEKSSTDGGFNFRATMKNWWKAIKLLARLTEDTDVEATISSIQKAVEFRGANIWILAFAIIVASVGLNVNSTAVIIGAMLISPLMGPINGIGLSLGISDSELLRKSLKNLLVMVVISLIVSTTYFFLTPLSDAQSELLARTNPTIFDVLIALFGGLAGIVALSRKDQPFTVISGVAIATALMPPLCTAGFGLATAQWNYFFGAFYLFFINSSFIAIATFTMVRYLHFPQKEYVDLRRRKFVKRIIFIVALIVIVPSVITAFAVVREASFNTQAIKFINDVQESESFKDVQIVKYDKQFLIIGNVNAITYKEIFDLIQKNKVWLGVNLGRGISGFIVPEHYDLYGTEVSVNSEGQTIIATNNCLWLTNLELKQRNEELDLSKEYVGNENDYPKYDNCDGINVNKTQDIPRDYKGLMGVPITFLHKYNPDQFEIVKFRKGDDGKDLSINGKCPYFRILIKNRRINVAG